MKIGSLIVALAGIVGVALGVYWDFIKHDHPTRGLYSLIAGAVVLVLGLIGFFVFKPKQAA